MDEKGIVYEHTINYYETDRMGIVHHSNYIRFFEEARIDYLNGLNILLQAAIKDLQHDLGIAA